MTDDDQAIADDVLAELLRRVGDDPNCQIKGNISAKGVRIYHVRGQKFYDRGNYDKAIEQLRLAETDNIEAQLLLARTYEAKGDRGLAQAHYSVLAKKYPDTAEGVYSRNRLKNF